MKIWIWWTVTNVGLIAIALGWYFFDLFNVLASLDKTYITFLIGSLTLSTTMTLPFYKDGPREWHWFISDAVLSMGMIGTLFGFLMVLGQSFVDIDTSSTESMTNAIVLLASGMSTALVTSLVGLISSVWLKLQLVALEA